MTTPRTRYAPSPTGPLNIGGARTALFNYLFAKKHGGNFVLRIEDTDLERSDPKYEKDILESLAWLGIDWNEGPASATTNYEPQTTNSYGPYRQSERIEAYKTHIEKLLADGKAFYCFHSETELEEERKQLMEIKKPPLHLCEYRTMDLEKAEVLKDVKTKYVIRFKTPAGRTLTFTDLIRGEISFESDLLGDFSIAKKIDVPLYNFAVVVDDQTMAITHVIRGEDHIPNTPKQLLLIEALGFETPQYAHLPLILGPDRSKLSKRHGATGILEYQEQGYLPEALFNFMALLGWNPGDDRELLPPEKIIKEFSLGRVQKSGAVFDSAKLDWMNGEYIRKKSLKELVELCEPHLKELLQTSNSELQTRNGFLEKIIALEQPRLKKLSEIEERTEYFFKQPEYDKALLRWKGMTDEEILTSLKKSESILSQLQTPNSKLAIEKSFFDGIGEGDKGKILWPLRVAFTGKKASPGPFEIIEILGKKESLARIEHAKKKLAS